MTLSKIRCIALIALIAAALGLFGGCARKPRATDTLRLASKLDPSTLDPAKAYDTSSINFARVLYRGLVDYDEKARLVNEVAKERRISPDARTYTFILRPDVYFHSGRRVVAADFRYAIERVLDPETASDGLSFYKIIEGAAEWSDMPKDKRADKHVSGITIKGEDEISFRLTRPDATFLNILAMPFAYAVPQEWVEQLEKEDKTLSENPNGCGPFKFVSWTHNASLKLVRNPRYHNKALPRVEKLNVEIGGDEALSQMRFELGDFDLQSEVPPADFSRLMHDKFWSKYIMHAPMMDIRYLCMNNEVAPFNDVRVRRAISYAINRAALVPLRSGRITPAKGPLPPGMPGYNPDLKGYDYEPERAKALLKEAGQENLKFTMWIANIDDYDKIGVSIQQDLRRIGVEVEVKQVTYSELKTLAGKRKQISVCILGWLQDFSDPSNFLDPLFNKKSITETASLNRAFYSNPKVNTLLDTAATETDAQKRLIMYQQAEQQIVEDAPLGFLFHTERYVMHQPWVNGYKLHPMWSARYEFIAVNGTDPRGKVN